MDTTTPPAAGAHPADATEGTRRGGFIVRRIVLAVGVVCLLWGLGMVAYVGWAYVGTDVVAEHRQSEIRVELRAGWQYPTVSDLLGPDGSVSRLGSADALIGVPRFGADYEVPMVEGVRDEDLALGIGHFPGTGPGQIGNFALTAHRVTNGDAFEDMASLRPGDAVLVETADAIYTYRLDTDPNDLVVPFSDGWVTEPAPQAPNGAAPPGMPAQGSSRPTTALITLTSCAELFHRATRMVAFGHLTDTTAK